MINYTYKLSNIEVKDVDDKSDVVHSVYVTIQGIDDVTYNDDSIIEKYDLVLGDLESFTEYESLTEDTILSWIEGNRFEGAKKSIELSIQTKNEVLVDKTLPWKVVVEPDFTPEPIVIDPEITGDTPDIEE